jgi:protoheme IX farnesyltransferase
VTQAQRVHPKFTDRYNRTLSQARLYWQIAKVPLCLLVSISTLFGYTVAAGEFGLHGLVTALSVLFLACGAASLNSRQEYRFDALHERTKRRPLALGLVTPQEALLLSRALLSAGFVLLLLNSQGLGPVIAAIFSVLLYNFCYTPLKYYTVWSIVPGALCGALPPLIGWLAGGGSSNSAVILLIMAQLAVWQVPHFWLVLLTHRGDYRLGTMPSMLAELEERKLRVISVVWVFALVIIAQVLGLVLHELPAAIRWIVSLAGFTLLAFYSFAMWRERNPLGYRFLFILLNIYMLVVMLLFSIGSLAA